jgi:hypothetical protein
MLKIKYIIGGGFDKNELKGVEEYIPDMSDELIRSSIGFNYSFIIEAPCAKSEDTFKKLKELHIPFKKIMPNKDGVPLMLVYNPVKHSHTFLTFSDEDGNPFVSAKEINKKNKEDLKGYSSCSHLLWLEDVCTLPLIEIV